MTWFVNFAPTWAAGLAATGVATATTADVRGTVALATVISANGSRYISVKFATPNTGIAAGADTKENSYGVTPFTS
jgi:hypothetical protein